MTLVEMRDAIVAAVAGVSGTGLKNVRPLSAKDVSKETGELVVIPPAALVVWGGTQRQTLDMQARLYTDHATFHILIVAENMAANETGEGDAMAILDKLRPALAGAEFTGTGEKAFLTLEDEFVEQIVAGKAVLGLTVRAKTNTQATA